MTHVVSGNVIVPKKFRGYNSYLANLVVMDFMARAYGDYIMEHSLNAQECCYKVVNSHDECIQPFIHVMDNPIPFIDTISSQVFLDLRDRNEEYRLLIVSIESGSHVSVSDIEDSREIYDATQRVYKSIKNKLPKTKKEGLEYLFDDERRLYTPRQFRDSLSHRSG